MISELLEVLMPDELSNTDKAIFVFLDGLALALMFAAVDWLIAGKPWPIGIGIVILAFILAWIAHNWSVVKPKLGKRLSVLVLKFERVASDYRYRTGSLFLIAFFIGSVILYNLHSTRKDIETYVIPRTVSETQAEHLRKFLSANPSDAKVSVLSNVGDTEATEYGSELFNAIRTSNGWEQAQFFPINPWDPEQPGQRKAVSKISLVLGRGLSINVCMEGRPINSDPKHPRADEILGHAFNQADIQVNSSGLTADCGTYYVNVVVAGRPEKLGQQTPPLQRLGEWISSLGQ